MATRATAIWIGAAALVQTVALGQGEAGWFRPDLLLVVALAQAFVAGPRAALAAAFAAGMATDLLSCGPVGLCATLDLLAAWAILRTRSMVFADKMRVQAVLALGAYLAVSFAHVGLLFLSRARPDLGAFLVRALGGAAAAAVLVPLLVETMGGVTRGQPALSTTGPPESPEPW